MAPQAEMATSSTTATSHSNNNKNRKMTQKRDDVPVEEDSIDAIPMDERTEDRRQEMLLCNVTDDMNSNLDPNLCDYTLKAMGEICGLSPKDKDSNRDPNAPREIPKHAFRSGADEHTSIEVEYVQPRLKQPVSSKAAAAVPVPETTTKKALLLQNISKKAREDYQKEVRSAPQAYPDDEYAQNTIYNTFSPPEKRKFIKFINMGVSPSEAADQVLRERREGAVAVQEQAKTPKEKKGLFRHFQKSKVEDDPEIPTSQFASSGINYYDAVRKVDVEGYQEPQDDDAATASNKNKKKKSILPKFKKKKRFSKVSGVEPKAAAPSSTSRSAPAATTSPTSNNGNNNNGAVLAGGAAVAGAAVVGAAAMETSRSHDPDDPEDDEWMPPPPPPSDSADPVAAAARGATLGASAMQSPVMTEEEVLRDLAMSDRGVSDIREEKKVEDDMAAQLLGPMGNNQQQHQVPVQISSDAHDLDDLDTYLNSTDLVSSYGGAGVADHLTVVSGKSYKTSNTNYTSASTRSRRPGQAQKRLEQQKAGEIQNRKARPASHQMRGWQETMQQAAAENNREWDPKLGWVDYANPNDPRPSNTAETEDVAPPSYDHRGRSMEREASPTRDPRKNGAAAAAPENQGSWVESMKAASARLLQAGKKWDPDRGWVGVNSGERSTPRHDDGKVNTQSESDTADFGISGAPGLLDTEGQDEKLMIYEDENSENESQPKGRYVQIGDSGSIHSHKGANNNAATRAPSLLVDVKKERVDADDAEYFSKRRSTGPVDLDDMEDEGENDAPATSTPRAIPKLKGPTRDTSPVSRSKAGMVTPEAGDADAKGGVGKLSQMWESRSSTAGGGEATTKSSEWKAFLAKKQEAETDANRQRDLGREDGAFPNNLSPIRKDNESDVASEASTAAMQPNTFMGRLQACAAPMMVTKNGASPRNSGMRFVPPALCGRPDAIAEEDDTTIGTETTPRSLRSRSRSRPRSSKSDVSSVISDEMGGSKAAFLESMAMKAVVSSKKSKRRSGGSEAGASSVASTPRSSTGGTPRGSTTSDNKWQQFLEKKKSESGNGSVVGARSQASTSHSRAAEKYAAKKVEEMMEAQRSQTESQGSGGFQSRPMEEATGAFPKPAKSTASSAVSTPSRIRTSLPFEPPKSASQIAAEEAKAKRLSALRASLSPRGQGPLI